MSPLVKRILIVAAPLLLRKLFRGKKVFRKVGLVLLIMILGVWLYSNYISPTLKDIVVVPPVTEQLYSNVASLYESHQSGVMVSVEGKVTRKLVDDVKGLRHQRFIILTHDEISVLIAHNIDLAPSVPLTVGDRVTIRGQYEWNHKGGVIHWTHHDPDKKHSEGWVLHNGIKYE